MRNSLHRLSVRVAGAIRTIPTLHLVRFATSIGGGTGGRVHLVFDPNNLRKVSRRRLRPLVQVVRGPLGEQLEIDLNDHVGYNIFMRG